MGINYQLQSLMILSFLLMNNAEEYSRNYCRIMRQVKFYFPKNSDNDCYCAVLCCAVLCCAVLCCAVAESTSVIIICQAPFAKYYNTPIA